MTGRKSKQDAKIMENQLKDIFLQGGITPYRASQVTGYDIKTIRRRFMQWASEIVSEENREPWLEREKRVRQRALEGLSSKLVKVRERLVMFEEKLDTIMQNEDTENDPRIELYERIIRHNMILDADLQQQYDAIEMTPPTEEVILKEIEKLIDQRKQMH